MARGFMALALAMFLGCTPDLTVQDAAPFQACTADQDCVLDSLVCGSCVPVGIAASDQQRFDQLRGCWPPASTTPCVAQLCGGTIASCVGGRCAEVTSPFCTGGGGAK